MNLKTPFFPGFKRQQLGWALSFLIALAGLFLLSGLLAGPKRVAAAGPSAQEFTVTCVDGVGPVDELVAAVNDANATTEPDTITIADGEGCTFIFEQPVGLSTALPEIFSVMTINGNGATFNRSPDANPMRFFWVHYTDLTLNDLTIMNGEAGAGRGGAIYADTSNVTLNDVILKQNGSNEGSAIYMWSVMPMTLTINSSYFTQNYAQDSGGAILVDGLQAALYINDSLFVDNQVIEGSGGALYTSGRATIVDSTFQQNKAHHYTSKGGAIFVAQPLEIQGSEFISNSLEAAHTYNKGGAVYAADTLTITQSTFQGNESYHSGAAVAVYGALTIEESLFANNHSNGGSSAVYAYEDNEDQRSEAITTVRNSQFTNNSGYYGGGLVVSSMEALTIEQSIFTGNEAVDFGGLRAYVNQTFIADSHFEGNTAEYNYGAMHVEGGDLTLLRTTVISNTAGSTVGGVAVVGNATIHDSLFSGNHGTRSYAEGGAIRVYGLLDLQRNVIINNSAGRNGSGLYLLLPSAGSSILQNNVWADNAVLNGPDNDGIGANIYVYFPAAGGDLTMAHNSIANSVGFSNDVAVQFHGLSGGAFLYNNIIANHQVGVEQVGATVITANNLYFSNVTDEVAVTSSSAHIVGEDPRFVDPAGVDYSLLPDSPAIDVAPFIGVTDDVRGVGRPQGDGYDIGAYEYTDIPPAPEDYLLFIPLVGNN